MSDSAAATPDDLLAAAARRADALRASGELPPDIDQRLADDYTRTVRRDTDRSPLDPEHDANSLQSAPAIDVSSIEVVASRPGGAALKRIANRMVRDQLVGLAAQTEQTRQATINDLAALAAEVVCLQQQVDKAAARSDMMAARIAHLERELSRRSQPDESPDDSVG